MTDYVTTAQIADRLNEGVCPKVHTKDWNRFAEALRQRREGKTFAAIGKSMGVSPQRVRQMVTHGEQREHALSNANLSPLDLLSERAKNCLRCGPIGDGKLFDEITPQVVRAWFDSGQLRNIPNMGKQSIQEVATWLTAIGA